MKYLIFISGLLIVLVSIFSFIMFNKELNATGFFVFSLIVGSLTCAAGAGMHEKEMNK